MTYAADTTIAPTVGETFRIAEGAHVTVAGAAEVEVARNGMVFFVASGTDVIFTGIAGEWTYTVIA